MNSVECAQKIMSPMEPFKPMLTGILLLLQFPFAQTLALKEDPLYVAFLYITNSTIHSCRKVQNNTIFYFHAVM